MSVLDSVVALGASGLGGTALEVVVEEAAGFIDPKPVKAANRGA